MKLLQVPKHSFLLLLISLLMMLVFAPYLKTISMPNSESVLLNPFIMTVLFTSLYLVTDNRKFFIVGLLLLIPVLIINTHFYFNKNSFDPLINSLIHISFFSYISVFLCRYLIKSKSVSLNVIYAAVCLYFFIAFIWSFIYLATYHVFDNAFYFSDKLIAHEGKADDPTSLFTYFSFVTMTTLGYGDMSPVHPVARSWVALQAVIGQLYLAIVMARLVGLYIVDAKKNKVK